MCLFIKVLENTDLRITIYNLRFTIYENLCLKFKIHNSKLPFNVLLMVFNGE